MLSEALQFYVIKHGWEMYVCWFLKQMIKAVAVPSNATTVKGTATHLRFKN